MALDSVAEVDCTPKLAGRLGFFVLTALLACGGGGRAREVERYLADLATATRVVSSLPLAAEVPIEEGSQAYRLGVGDVLSIFVVERPELSSQRVELGQIAGSEVKEDGKIYLPLLGGVPAAGLTILEMQESLRRALESVIREPRFTVDVLRYGSQRYYLLGAIRSPGAYPVDGRTTLLDALARAGGPEQSGDLDAGYVTRGGKLLPIDLHAMLYGGDLSRNPLMRDGDLVFIPPASDQRVLVVGEVRTPGTHALVAGRMTLTEALARSGGIDPLAADEEYIKVIRGGWAAPTVYTFRYQDVLLADADLLLLPGDRVVVEPTPLTEANRFLQQIVPFLSFASQSIGTARLIQTTVNPPGN